MKKKDFIIGVFIFIVLIIFLVLLVNIQEKFNNSSNKENSAINKENIKIPKILKIGGGNQTYEDRIRDYEVNFIKNQSYSDSINYTSKKINLFFIPTYQASIEEIAYQKERVSKIKEELFKISPFNVYQNKFEFYFLEFSPNFSCEVGSSNCPDREFLEDLIKQNYNFSSEEIHQIIIFRNGRVTGGGGISEKPLGYGDIYFYINYSGIVLAHELGHSFGNFGDEYFKGDVRASSQVTGENNIGLEGCSNWCSGKLDESNEFYQYYFSWKECVLSKGLNLNPTEIFMIEDINKWKYDWNSCWDEWAEKYYNITNSKEFVEECPYIGFNYSPSTTLIINPVEKQFNCNNANKFENLNLGKDCIENTGCYFTGNGVNAWRQLENSIMRGSPIIEDIENAKFGAYSKNLIDEIIQNLTD